MKTLQKLLSLLVIFALTSFVFFFYTSKNDRELMNLNSSCGRYPRQEDIFTDNLIWQVLQTPSGFTYLLNAYLDARWNKTIVRVNAISRPLNITTQKLFCQFWFDEKSPPAVIEASEYQKTFLCGDLFWK